MLPIIATRLGAVEPPNHKDTWDDWDGFNRLEQNVYWKVHLPFILMHVIDIEMMKHEIWEAWDGVWTACGVFVVVHSGSGGSRGGGSAGSGGGCRFPPLELTLYL